MASSTQLPKTPREQAKVPGYLRVSKIAVWLLYAWTIFGIILLGLRVFLLAFSANSTTPFVEFVYRTSADYLEPFRGIFSAKTVGETGYFDVAAVFAIIIYLLLAWGFSSLINHLQAKIDESVSLQEEKYKMLEQRQAASKQPAKPAAKTVS